MFQQAFQVHFIDNNMQAECAPCMLWSSCINLLVLTHANLQRPPSVTRVVHQVHPMGWATLPVTNRLVEELKCWLCRLAYLQAVSAWFSLPEEWGSEWG